MPITSGTRLGPYEIVSRIGAGGMGEVFKGRDTRLERSVAIKVLPPDFASDPLRLARFEREAKTISQLNHPNICTVHDYGHDEGTTYLVMELVEGQSLAERLARGPLPLSDVVRYGSQIADALDRAHRAGIVHRDLKPGNVMITRTGAKLLDFGLAHTKAPDSGPDAPTQQPLTGEGSILGTLPYMSPEQLEGTEVDSRSDIFAFGAVLYEMVTGKRAFSAATTASLVVKILEHPAPRPSETQSVTPPALEHIILTCLEKDRESRFQCAADIAHELRWVGVMPAPAAAEEGATPVAASGGARRARWIAATAALMIAAAAFSAFLASRLGRGSAAQDNVRFTQLTFDRNEETQPTVAPDGKMFAFVRADESDSDIFLQRVDGRSAINLTSDNRSSDSQPAFSPDGNLIAFRSEREGGGIFVMGATGESVRRVSDKGFNPSWSPDGKEIIFSAQETSDPSTVFGFRNMYVADATSGATRLLYNGTDSMQPSWSPHGHRVAFWTVKGGRRDIVTIDRSGNASTIVTVTDDGATDWNPVWSADGRHLYFCSDRDGTMNIWRVAIDEKSGKVLGKPEPLRTPSTWSGFISMAREGRLILYQASSEAGELLRTNFDPATERLSVESEPLFAGSTGIRHLNTSPDGRWIAFTTRSAQEDLFVMAADGSGVRQLTNDVHRDRGVSWWPDSSRMVFYSNRSGEFQGWSIRVDGSGLTQLTEISGGINWPRISPDGRKVAYVGDIGKESGVAALTGPLPARQPEKPLPDTPYGQFSPWSWSPDGRLIAGGTWTGSTRGDLYIYSTADQRLRPIQADALTAKFIDERRVLFYDAQDRVGVADAVTGAVRFIGTLPRDAGLQPTRTRSGSISDPARSIVIYRTRTESDVWQMSLPDPKQ